MKPTGKPGAQRAAAIEAISASDSPIGMSMAEILAVAGGSPKAMSLLLGRMVLAGQVFAIGRHREMRYFATAERAHAAAEPYAQHLAEVEQERRIKRAAVKVAYKQRYRQRCKVNKVGRPIGQSGTVISAVMNAVCGCEDALGIGYAGLAALGAKKTALMKALEILRERGVIFVWGFRNWRRFFSSEAARDAAAPRLEEIQAANAASGRAAYSKQRNIALREAEKQKRGPKPEKAVKKAPAVNAPVIIKAQPRTAFKDQPAIVPKHVKPIQCKGFVPRTFLPPPGFKGEFQREWSELRGVRS